MGMDLQTYKVRRYIHYSLNALIRLFLLFHSSDETFLRAFHFEKMRNTCYNMQSTVWDACFCKRVPILIYEDKARDILNVVMEELHEETKNKSAAAIIL